MMVPQSKSRRPRVNQNTRTVRTTTTLGRSQNRPREEKKSNPVDAQSMRSSNTVNLTYAPLYPAAVKRKLVYYDYFNLTTTSGVLNSYVFSVNGLYDPNITGGGHQPSGFDQMMTFYDHYAVIRSKCTVQYHNSATGAAPSVCLSLNSTQTAPTDVTTLRESGYIVTDWLNLSTVDDAVKTLVLTCDVSKFQGVPQVRDAQELWGTAASNPTEQSYYNVSVYDIGGGTATVTCQVLLEFEAWFLEPRKISPSLQKIMHQQLRLEARQATQ